MKITTALKINSLLTAVVVIIMGIIFAVSFVLRQDTMKMDAVAMGIVTGAFELNALNNSYLSRPEDRPLEQWKLKQIELLQRIKNSSIQNNEQRVLLKRIGDNLTVMGMLFQRIASSHESGRTLPGSSDANRRAAQQIVRLMSLYSLDLVRDASQLAEENHKKVASVNRIIWLFIPASALVMVGIAMWFSAVLIRRIGKPFAQLSAGAEIIGSGNLDYRFGIRSNDEVGDLASAFDSMTTRLKQITVSRNELAGEIEERKRTEAELRVSELERERLITELQRSNTELEQFAYVASHDLQEPLRMVASFVQLLEKKYKDKLDSKANHYIDRVVDGASRMQSLIEGLLSYSRIGRKEITFSKVDTNAIFERALLNLSEIIHQTDAVITKDELPSVLGDATQLVQLFQNLIGNAVKYKRPDVRPQVHVSAKQEDKQWIFSVRDNGIGMEPQYFDQIFQIFQRLHTRENYPGTGIGLALCKRIAERHHGRIWVESVSDESSTFFFTLAIGGGQ
jgi:signal transduction histidine kinase